MAKPNVYTAIIERIFKAHFRTGLTEFDFSREEIISGATKLRIKLPKNVGDLVYSFRYRAALPELITKTAPPGKTWVIRPAGRSLYRFALISDRPLTPSPNLIATKIPDATPGVVERYALSDEQALLAKLRYNRLIDTFLGLTCYSLQNHLRTQVPGLGQTETDEIYIGIDKRGAHYVIPVQAKGGSDRLSIVQIEQDTAMSAHLFKGAICRAIGAQFMKENIIALFEFGIDGGGFGVIAERHYVLVPKGEISDEDLAGYSKAAQ